jgi:hypothetical protein
MNNCRSSIRNTQYNIITKVKITFETVAISTLLKHFKNYHTHILYTILYTHILYSMTNKIGEYDILESNNEWNNF